MAKKKPTFRFTPRGPGSPLGGPDTFAGLSDQLKTLYDQMQATTDAFRDFEQQLRQTTGRLRPGLLGTAMVPATPTAPPPAPPPKTWFAAGQGPGGQLVFMGGTGSRGPGGLIPRGPGSPLVPRGPGGLIPRGPGGPLVPRGPGGLIPREPGALVRRPPEDMRPIGRQRPQTIYLPQQQPQGYHRGEGEREPAVRGLMRSFGEIGGAAGMASAALMGLVHAASPDAAATMTGSFQMLSAEIGTDLMPGVREFSGGLQALSREWRQMPREIHQAVSSIGTVLANATPLVGGLFGGWGQQQRPDPQIFGGFRSQMTSIEGFRDMIAQQAVEMPGNQRLEEIQADALRELTRMNVNLQALLVSTQAERPLLAGVVGQ